MAYGVVHSPEIGVVRDSVPFSFTDDGSGDDHPRAETTLTKQLEIDLNRPEFGGPSDYAIAILRGWSLVSKCDPAKQPPSLPCNSNGMWPYRIFVGITEQTKIDQRLCCTFQLDIFRGWTPSEGGGKPFNDRLDISVTVFYTVIAGKQVHFRPTIGARFTVENQIHEVPVRSNRTLTGYSGYPFASLGLTTFGFELLETNNRPDLGRYMISLSFCLLNPRYDRATARLDYDSVMGFKAPLTVIESQARYTMQPVLLQFSSAASSFGGLSITPPITSDLAPDFFDILGRITDSHLTWGQVCVSGAGFSCDSSNLISGREPLPERTTDTVIVSHSAYVSGG